MLKWSRVKAGQSITISDVIWYSANFCMSIGSNVRNVTISNSIFSFSRYCAINAEEAASNIRAVAITGCTFVSNEQYHTFIGYVHSRASSIDMQFGNCSFRNWRDYAINHAAGENVSFAFSGCVFDAARSSEDHNQSATARVLYTGLGGRYHFASCRFHAIQGDLASLNAGLHTLILSDCDVDATRNNRFIVGPIQDAIISVRNVRNSLHLSKVGKVEMISLPTWGVKTVWRLEVGCTIVRPDGSLIPFAQESILSYGVSDKPSQILPRLMPVWSSPLAADQEEVAELRIVEAEDEKLIHIQITSKFGRIDDLRAHAGSVG